MDVIYGFYEKKQEVIMAYDTLVEEAKDLPDNIVEQTLMFMRFLSSNFTSANQANISQQNVHRTVNPLADDFISIADDFDATPDCFAEYM